MTRRFALVCAMIVGAAARQAAGAQSDTVRATLDTTATHAMRLRDGSTLVGRILQRDSATIRFATNGGVLIIPVANVAELRTIHAGEIHNGEYWFPDPNSTRLFFAPTGRMLAKGEGYYSNTYLVLQNFVAAPSDRFTIGGGFTVIPSNDFLNNNAYYVTPKVGLYRSPNTNAAVGVLAGYIPTNNGHSFGILYGVATQGSPDASLTGGIGYGYMDGTLSNRPALMLGGAKRLSRRFSFVSENYGIWTRNETEVCSTFGCASTSTYDFHSAFSYGLRFMGEKLSTDFAFVNYAGSGIFPGIPYIAFAVKF